MYEQNIFKYLPNFIQNDLIQALINNILDFKLKFQHPVSVFLITLK